MYKDGVYFTGEKTLWAVTSTKQGNVVEIVACIKGYDTQGRVFKTDPAPLSTKQLVHALIGIKEQQQVIDELISDAYYKLIENEHITAEEESFNEQYGEETVTPAEIQQVPAASEEGSEGSADAGENRSDAAPAEGEGSGAIMEDGQTAG